MAKVITNEEWSLRLEPFGWKILTFEKNSDGRVCGLCECLKCGKTEYIKSFRVIVMNKWTCLQCADKQLICNGCGEKFSLIRTGGLKNVRDYCYNCVPLGLGNDIVSKYNAQLKRARVEFGDVCSICGFSESYGIQYHHLDPSIKENALSNLFGRASWNKVEEELQKCIIVCANCHAGIHAGAINIDLRSER